jgi:hypothetical protein
MLLHVLAMLQHSDDDLLIAICALFQFIVPFGCYPIIRTIVEDIHSNNTPPPRQLGPRILNTFDYVKDMLSCVLQGAECACGLHGLVAGRLALPSRRRLECIGGVLTISRRFFGPCDMC